MQDDNNNCNPTQVEELKREVGKLKGHILSQVDECSPYSLVTTFSGRGADEGEKGNGKFQVFSLSILPDFCFRYHLHWPLDQFVQSI